MSFATFNSKQAVAERCWKSLLEERKNVSLLGALLMEMDVDSYVELPQTMEHLRAFLEEMAERAWKTGFVDALNLVEIGAVTITKGGNN